MRTTVYFATNRPVSNDGSAPGDYGAGIVQPSDPQRVTYATAFVDGTDLQAGQSGSILDIQDVSLGGFSEAAAGDLGAPGRNILVFIHGFDNDFTDAITRAAYNREWMAASGAVSADMSVVTFSWPSGGQLFEPPFPTTAYQRDQTMAGQSGVHIMDFLARLQPLLDAARQSGARCYLLCHSMGNWALQAAVESWFSHGNGDAEMFDEVILAAADERYDTFDFPQPGRLSGLASLSRRVSVYYSHADLVLALSSVVNHGLPRLGQDGPHHRNDAEAFPAGRYRMVDCSAFRDYPFDFGSSHQYYRRSALARADIISIL